MSDILPSVKIAGASAKARPAGPVHSISIWIEPLPSRPLARADEIADLIVALVGAPRAASNRFGAACLRCRIRSGLRNARFPSSFSRICLWSLALGLSQPSATTGKNETA